MKNQRHGFTLVEILLVSAMFSLISLAVFNAFANGFKLWARVQHVIVEGNTAIFMERMTEDLRHTVIISNIPFKGDSTEISFPALIWGATDTNGSRAKEETGEQIGAVRYVFDPSQKKIFRYQATYGQALKLEWSQPVEVAEEIEDITVRYYFKADQGLEEKTQADVEKTSDELPMGLMIDVQYLVDGQAFDMRRFMIVPAGGGI